MRNVGFLASLIAIGGFAAGCANVNFLSPTLLQDLGLSSNVANLPDDAPAIVVEVENATARVVEIRLTWRDPDGQIEERTRALGPGGKYAEAIVCPIDELTLGDVGNLNAVGAIVRLGAGGANDPFVEVDPFGVLLQEGINYTCGDLIAFEIDESAAARSGYQVIAFIRRAN